MLDFVWRDSSERLATVVLAAVDDSDAAGGVLRAAAEIARETRGELHVLSVLEWIALDPVPLHVSSGVDEAIARARAHVELLAAQAVEAGVLRVVCHVAGGAAPAEIVTMAARTGADLVVVGSHGHRGVRRLLLGSVAERVVRDAGCRVLVVRPKSHAPVA